MDIKTLIVPSLFLPLSVFLQVWLADGRRLARRLARLIAALICCLAVTAPSPVKALQQDNGGISDFCRAPIVQRIILQNDTIIQCNVRFRSAGSLFVEEGVKVEIAGRIKASRRQIFEGPGQVIIKQSKRNRFPMAFPEWFGADAMGSRDSAAAMQRTVDSLVDGGTVAGHRQAIYRLLDSVTISENNITFDMHNAIIKGPRTQKRIICNGDLDFPNRTPGDWTTALRNCVIRNIRFGDANDISNRFAGVGIRWCIECGAENIVKQGFTGTGFTMNVCRDCFFRNINNYGSASNRIGFLLHMTWNSVIDNCHVFNGPFLYAFQVKGGSNNLVIDSSVEGLFLDASMKRQQGFRDRGDAPWMPSLTVGSNITYPFADKDWDEADARRASHNTRFINLRVSDSEAASAYTSQESVGTRFEDVKARAVLNGIAFTRIPDGEEEGFSVEDFSIRDVRLNAIVVQSTDTDRLRNVSIKNGSIKSDINTIRVTNTDGVGFSCVSLNGNELQEGDLLQDNALNTNIEECDPGREKEEKS